MEKNRIRKVEVIMGILFLAFASLIVAGSLLKKEKDVPEEIIEENTEYVEEIDFSAIRSISGKYSYEDENYTSLFGIDVSEFQEKINWKKVKEDGVEFAYIRMGRRGATTGLLYEDQMFEENYKGAKENGILTGVYFFSQAKDEKEAQEDHPG